MGMNNTISFPVNSGLDAYALVGELKDLGLRANKDFTWSFKPRQGDYFSSEGMIPPSVTFTFVEESMASFIRLKWS
jgi:hypothetical protein